jgi:hypothetical protein
MNHFENAAVVGSETNFLTTWATACDTSDSFANETAKIHVSVSFLVTSTNITDFAMCQQISTHSATNLNIKIFEHMIRKPLHHITKHAVDFFK